MEERKKWSSNILFIMACVGSAVGLGNIWKFPYITYENDGGTFVFIYLFAILIMGLPVLIAEIMIGRKAEANAFQAIKKLSKNSKMWAPLGMLCIITAFSILSFYSVVAGWTLSYFYNSLVGNLAHLNFETTGPYFGSFVGDATSQIGFHTLVIALTSLFVLKGTKSIEKAIEVLMPVFGVLLIVIAGTSIYKYGFSETQHFLFHIDFSKVTSHTILEAFGHAFFTLSIGMGAMIIYGSYFPKDQSILKASLWIAALDTIIALIACTMIFPIIFGTNMNVSESASILFTTLSVELHSFPGGQYISATFYLLIAFAALSSTISLLEPIVAFMIEQLNFTRKKALLLSAFSVWGLGLFSAISNGANETFTSLKVMDTLDYLTSNWSLPIGGLLISIFAGWALEKERSAKALGLDEKSAIFKTWYFLIKFVSPVLMTVIFGYKLIA